MGHQISSGSHWYFSCWISSAVISYPCLWRERERKDGEFAFERPEQIQISSACQGQSAHVILLVLEKLYCAAAQEKILETKGLQEPEEVLTGLPQPTPPAKKAGSWWDLEAVVYLCLRGMCFWHPKKCRTKRLAPTNTTEVCICNLPGGGVSPSKGNKVFREEPLQCRKPCQSCAFILHAPWGVTLPRAEKSLNK